MDLDSDKDDWSPPYVLQISIPEVVKLLNERKLKNATLEIILTDEEGRVLEPR